MLKILAFFSLVIFTGTGNPKLQTDQSSCTCPEVSNLQKTNHTSDAIAYSWANAGVQYKLWYHREEDNYTSGFTYTYSYAYTFSGLPSGHYTFYFQAICGGEASGYIGTEDVIMN